VNSALIIDPHPAVRAALLKLLGPTLRAYFRQRTGNYTESLDLIAGIMLVATLLPLWIRPPQQRPAAPV
jgi:hypothetical protein